MPMFKTVSTTTQAFFKPTYKVDYKPVSGDFKLYNTETKEITEIKELTFVPVMFLQKVITKDFGQSQMFANYFGDKIIMRDGDFKYVGTYKFNKDKRRLIEVTTGAEADFAYETSLFIVGLNESLETITIQINGIAKMDLTLKKDDKTNEEKIKTFNESTMITLKSQTETITVGKKPAVKKIYLLDVTGTSDELSKDIQEKGVELNEIIQAELDYYQNKDNEVVTKEKTLEEFAEEEFVNIEDRPF